MLLNYLRLTLRILMRQKIYTGINLLGLAIGITVCMMVFLFVRDEFSYNRFYPNSDRIYQVNQVINQPGQDSKGTIATPMGLGSALKENFPEVESFCRVTWRNSIIKLNDNSLLELVYFVDPNYFDLFSSETIEGDISSALRQPEGVVISESIAKKYFGEEWAIDQTLPLLIGYEYIDMVVKAVIADPPKNSTIQCKILIPISHLYDIFPDKIDDNWQYVYPETFVLLQEGVSPSDIEVNLDRLYEKHNFEERFGKDVISYRFKALTDLYLRYDYNDTLFPQSNPLYSYMMILIAILVITAASVNYTTLSMGRSVSRSKEVGVRKVLGAKSNQLWSQFLGESILLCLFAIPIAFALTELILPMFNSIIGKSLVLNLDSINLMGITLIVGAVGLISGSYPAFALSSQSSAKIFRGDLKFLSGRFVVKMLVFTQFAISTTLLIATIVVSSQLRYLANKDLGFSSEKVLSIFIPDLPEQETFDHVKRAKTEFTTFTEIESVASATQSFSNPWSKFTYNDKHGYEKNFWGNQIDSEYLLTMGIELVEGRNFDPEIASDKSEGIIVNEALVSEYGWENPIGKELSGSFGQHHVIGVVKDFNFQSLHVPVGPLAMYQSFDNLSKGVNNPEENRGMPTRILVKINSENMVPVLNRLESKWHQITGSSSFTASFISENIRSTYQTERAIGKVVNFTAIVTLLITVVGIFGMVSLTVAKRTKEIGIRKVMGASVPQLVTLLTSEISRLVILANLVAWPIGFFALNAWLKNYAYHIPLSIWIFVVAGIGSLIIALIAGGTLAYKASTTNPSHTLKQE
jgi:putative ABC transport system permease protein